MKVAVVGAGGVGSVFGGRLAAAGHEVWLVHRRREVVDVLQRDGLRLEGPLGDERLTVHATDATDEIGAVDLVLILTKSTETRSAAEAARPLIGDKTVVLSLQNGLGNLETIGEVLGPPRVLLGMTYAGAALVGPGHARLTAVGQTFIGEPTGGRSARVDHLAEVLSAAGMPTAATDQLWEMVWGKLVINAARAGRPGNRRRGPRARRNAAVPGRRGAGEKTLSGRWPLPAVDAPGHGARPTDRERGDQRRGGQRRRPAWVFRRPTTRRYCCWSKRAKKCAQRAHKLVECHTSGWFQ